MARLTTNTPLHSSAGANRVFLGSIDYLTRKKQLRHSPSPAISSAASPSSANRNIIPSVWSHQTVDMTAGCCRGESRPKRLEGSKNSTLLRLFKTSLTDGPPSFHSNLPLREVRVKTSDSSGKRTLPGFTSWTTSVMSEAMNLEAKGR